MATVATNPFAILDAEEDMWEEVVKRKKKGKMVILSPLPPPPRLPPTLAPGPMTRPKVVAPALQTPSSAPSSGMNTIITLHAVQERPQRRTHDVNGHPLANDYYRAFQRLTLDNRTGDVTLRFHTTDIVRIKANGDVRLSCDGYYTLTTMLSMNDALQHVNVRVKNSAGNMTLGEWTVEDPYCKYSFADNMTLKAHSAADKLRAGTIFRAYHIGACWPGVAVAGPSAPPLQHPEEAQCRPQTGPQQPPAAPMPGERPTMACHLACSSSVRQHVAWQEQERQDQECLSMAGVAGLGVVSLDSEISTDPSVNLKVAALTAKDYEQWISESMGNGPRVNDVEKIDDMEEATCNDEHLCVVCLERERDTVLVPCGHMALCEGCCDNIMQSNNKHCPLCRQPVSMHVII